MNNSKKGTLYGLSSGILWGLDTVLIGVILSFSPFSSYTFLAPFVSTFLHDFFSSFWMLLYTLKTKQGMAFLKALKTRSGAFVMLAALLGGPLGMTCYMLAIQNIGAAKTAIISSMYPAVGAFFSYLFLKEKMTTRGFFGLFLAIGATIFLGLSTNEPAKHLSLGLIFALCTVLGWSLESVISAYGMKEDVTPEVALQIRQFVSAFVYGLLLLPLLKGYPIVSHVIKEPLVFLLLLTALAGTISYLCYYTAIDTIGPVKAMGLNISYSGWAIFIGLFFGQPLHMKEMVLALLVLIGSMLTTDQPLRLPFLKQMKKNKE